MTRRAYYNTITGTPVPLADRERAAKRPGDMVVYQMSQDEMQSYLEERYGKKAAAAKPAPTREEYLQRRLDGETRSQALKGLFNSTSQGYLALDRWGLRDLKAEEAELDALRGEIIEVLDEAAPTVEVETEAHTAASQTTEHDTSTHPLTFTLVCHEDIARTVLEALIEDVHVTARSKGWHETDTPLPIHLALIHSEVSEALEADRKGEGVDNVAEELADVVIRTFDTAAAHGIDLAGALLTKMAKNKTRAYRHGGRRY
ncbi:hypothetical protein Alches_17410 [Alicyclobacillus hesperidum subsp. aegles]|uniref:MazG nucleotide pyrophosphohydrolase domain-containing protein n=1 Tax=Alicyclobacillus hesperidum TaxID=89784 RepID=UPI002229A1D2|nr:MazG nucleotide pyrophosphohydrolase domain-containing protein [Alicyclobacillus hesperidum]GLG01701.1 hypothetical protein Alches_17410 [Alicyclobacillus hesperidum subsp. aegles]